MQIGRYVLNDLEKDLKTVAKEKEVAYNEFNTLIRESNTDNTEDREEKKEETDSGIFNNPFIIWGRYKKKWFRYYLPLSFQFHHTQMDGAHAGVFLKNLQNEINLLK